MATARSSITLGTGSDALILRISEDAYKGDARYTIKVDGQQIGGTLTAGALHAKGEFDAVTLKGNWAAGPHTVQVTFLNDLWVSGSGDRNLHLDGATYNGATVAGASLDLMSSGTKTFTFTEAAAPASPTIPAVPSTPAPAPAGHHQFFSDASPWNTAVASTAKYQEVQGLDALMDKHGIGLTAWDAGWPSVAIYYASASDPLEEVRWIGDTWSPVNGGGVKRFGNSAAVDASLLSQSKAVNPYPMNPYSTQHAGKEWNSGGAASTAAYNEWTQTTALHVRVPAGAVPASDGDGYMVVVQPDGQALELYSPIKLGDGTLVSMMYSLTDTVNGLGTGAENGRRAAMVPSYAGAITDKDIAAGKIDHAMAMNLPASMLTTAFTGPALAFDSNDGYSGTVPMGSRFALSAAIDIDALGLQTSLGHMIADAMQHYGIYAVDRGGGGITISTQYAPKSSLLSDYSWPVQHDLETIFHAAQLVQPAQVIWG